MLYYNKVPNMTGTSMVRTCEKDQNIIRVKNNANKNEYEQNMHFMNQKIYATKKVFEEFQYNDLKVLARGNATTQAFQLVSEVKDYLIPLGENGGKKLYNYFPDSENQFPREHKFVSLYLQIGFQMHNTVHTDEYLKSDDKIFNDCENCLHDRFLKLIHSRSQ